MSALAIKQCPLGQYHLMCVWCSGKHGDVSPALVQRWATVRDGGPTLNQSGVKVPYLPWTLCSRGSRIRTTHLGCLHVVGHHAGHHHRLIPRVHQAFHEIVPGFLHGLPGEAGHRVGHAVRGLVVQLHVSFRGHDANFRGHEEPQSAVRPRYGVEQI